MEHDHKVSDGFSFLKASLIIANNSGNDWLPDLSFEICIAKSCFS